MKVEITKTEPGCFVLELGKEAEKPCPVEAGRIVEVSEHVGEQFIARGVAKAVAEAPKKAPKKEKEGAK